MADGSSYALSVRYFNTETAVLSNRKRETSLLPGLAILTMDTSFTGPFNKNWLFMGAQLRSRNMLYHWMPIPFKPDAVTVHSMDYEGNITVWEVFEDLTEYRSWQRATQAVVVMSGGVYGGVVDVKYVDSQHTIITSNFYMTSIYCESVRLVPMVEGRVIASEVLPTSVKIEVEMNLKQLAEHDTRPVKRYVEHLTSTSLYDDF